MRYAQIRSGQRLLLGALAERRRQGEDRARAEVENDGAVFVCPICDIAGCAHIRAALGEGDN